MSEKTSQKTEEEMLDQTFGGYDEEMTAQTEDPQTAAPAAQGEKKKSNQNLIIFGAGGIAALGVLGWMFMKGQTPAPQQPQQPVAQTATQAPTPPQPASAPVQQAAQVQPDVNASTPAGNVGNTASTGSANPNSNSNDAAAANFLSNQPNNPMAGNKQVDATQPVNPSVNPVASATAPDVNASASTPVVNTVNPVNNVPNTTTSAVSPVSPNVVAPVVAPVVNNGVNGTGNNAVQQALVDQLKQMFDQQTKEIKSSVDQVGNRVTDLEKAVADQKNVNKSIEDRLARLEAGKPTKVASSSSSNDSSANDTTTTKEAKPVVKARKVYHRHTVVRRVVREKQLDNDQSVLVDKSAERSAPVYGDVRIHSVYAGRVWIKNKDGSLSTYASGERLPDGEVIRRIDDDKAQIITDKRVIR